MKMNLCSLLAATPGEINLESGQNPLLNSVKNAKKGEFAAIVQQLRSGGNDRQNAETSTDDTLSPQDVVGSEISSKLVQLLVGKEVKQQTSEQDNLDIALSEIAAMIEANPEKCADLEGLSLPKNQLSPENLEKIAEIKDYLAAIQNLPGQTAEDLPATLTTEAANTATAAQATADITLSSAAGENTVLTNEISEPAQQLTPELPQIAVANESSQTVVTNSTQQPIAEQLQAIDMAETVKTSFSNLNETVIQASQTDSQQQNPAAPQTSSQKTDALTTAVQQALNGTETMGEQSSLPKVAPSPEQILAKGAENRQNPFSQGFKADIEGLEPVSEEQSSLGDSGTVDPGPQTPAFAKPGVNSVSNAEIARQVQETVSSAYRPGSKQIVIRLDPPELGKVTMRFIEKADGITGVLQVDQPQTRQEIERALPEIIQNLQNSSVQIKKVDVVATHHQNDDPNRSDSPFAGQDSEFQQQQNGPRASAHQGGFQESAGEFENVSQSNRPDMQLDEKSINMLI